MKYPTMTYVTISHLFILVRKLLFFLSITNKNKKKRNLPPSPPSLPIIGHLHLLTKPYHQSLSLLSTRYGPILHLRFGSRPVLIVSSASVAEECLVKNDIAFSNRPQFPSIKDVSYDYTSLPFANHGPLWHKMRYIATTEVLSSLRLNSFSDVRARGVRAMVGTLFREHYPTREGYAKVAMRSRLFDFTLKNMMTMIAGDRKDNNYQNDTSTGKAEKFQETVEAVFRAELKVGDCLPALEWMNFFAMKKSARLRKFWDEFMQEMIDESRKEENESSMIGLLLSRQKSDPEYYTDQIIKSLIITMLVAATDTVSITMEWALSLLLNNPEKLKKARHEIDSLIGSGQRRLLQESDISHLPYLHCIITETLRLYPAGPLLVPRESQQDCVISGYHVPCGTILFVNAYAIHRDEKTWPDPNGFWPERFGGDHGGGGEEQKLMAFGRGRRRCPGEGLAGRDVGMVVGAMIQCFDWERIGEEEVDMSEGSGVSMPRVHPLEAMYKPRKFMYNVLQGF